ncbi:formate dehydrogenase [Methylibium sp.]|uniref:formate dehydrogenase n=1 Tax=Methylibium sp. TaxID=2067992 RepID=UPI003D0BBE0C
MNDPKSKLSRRRVFAGAGTLGALAAAAAVLPVARETEPAAAAAGVKPEPDKSGGYRLTAHVQRYYQTTKV